MCIYNILNGLDTICFELLIVACICFYFCCVVREIVFINVYLCFLLIDSAIDFKNSSCSCFFSLTFMQLIFNDVRNNGSFVKCFLLSFYFFCSVFPQNWCLLSNFTLCKCLLGWSFLSIITSIRLFVCKK